MNRKLYLNATNALFLFSFTDLNFSVVNISQNILQVIIFSHLEKYASEQLQVKTFQFLMQSFFFPSKH